MHHIFWASQNKNQINYFKSFKKNNPFKSDIYILHQYESFSKKNINELHVKNIYGLFVIFYKLPRNSRIVFHDYSSFLLAILLLIYRNKFEFSWIIWGWDLYSLSNKNFKNLIRKYSLKYFSQINGYKQDFEYLNSENIKKVQFKEFVYSPPTLESFKNVEHDFYKIEKKSVLIGHSASQDNNHIECFDYVQKYLEKSFKVYCILSYGGNSEYIDIVKNKGYEIFGDKFVPITSFMPPNEFKLFLLSVKFAFLFNKRQSAVGFIYTCLLQGVQIIMFKTSTPYEYFTSKGVILHDIQDIKKINFLSAEKETIRKNSTLIIDIYSKQNLVNFYNNLR